MQQRADGSRGSRGRAHRKGVQVGAGWVQGGPPHLRKSGESCRSLNSSVPTAAGGAAMAAARTGGAGVPRGPIGQAGGGVGGSGGRWGGRKRGVLARRIRVP